MRQEIITRRNLPHWYKPGAIHFVTYRLHGTLPQTVLDDLHAKKESMLAKKPDNVPVNRHRETVHKKLFAEYDRYLDRSRERLWLQDRRIAAIIRGNLYHHHGTKYYLLAYCVMPNHVHVLLQPIDRSTGGSPEPLKIHEDSGGPPELRDEDIGEQKDGHTPLSSIMHSLKSYTAHEANKVLQRTGEFWQAESYDHWVRDEDELERIVNYIAANPVDASLTPKHEDWYYCSCHDRLLMDGTVSGWLGWPTS